MTHKPDIEYSKEEWNFSNRDVSSVEVYDEIYLFVILIFYIFVTKQD